MLIIFNDIAIDNIKIKSVIFENKMLLFEFRISKISLIICNSSVNKYINIIS